MRHGSTGWLLLIALFAGLLIGSGGHDCSDEPGAASSALAKSRLVEVAAPGVLTDLYCPVCFLLLHSRAAATDRAARQPTLPDFGGLVGRLADSSTAQADRPLPPARAPPLLG